MNLHQQIHFNDIFGNTRYRCNKGPLYYYITARYSYFIM